MSKLQPHQQRVIEEFEALYEKVTKLNAFVESPKFLELGVEDRSLLHEQLGFMWAYANVLSQRIARF